MDACLPQDGISRFSPYHYYKSTKRLDAELLGTVAHNFTDNLAEVYSIAMMRNNVHLLTTTQEKIFTQYLKEADTGLSTTELKQLDAYLGSI